MLPYKPSIVGYPHDYGNIQIDKHMLKCFYCKFTQIYQLTMESGAFLGASLNMLAIYPTLQGSPQASSSDRIRTALLRLSTLIRNVPWLLSDSYILYVYIYMYITEICNHVWTRVPSILAQRSTLIRLLADQLPGDPSGAGVVPHDGGHAVSSAKEGDRIPGLETKSHRISLGNIMDGLKDHKLSILWISPVRPSRVVEWFVGRCWDLYPFAGESYGRRIMTRYDTA